MIRSNNNNNNNNDNNNNSARYILSYYQLYLKRKSRVQCIRDDTKDQKCLINSASYINKVFLSRGEKSWQ